MVFYGKHIEIEHAFPASETEMECEISGQTYVPNVMKKSENMYVNCVSSAYILSSQNRLAFVLFLQTSYRQLCSICSSSNFSYVFIS